MSPHLPERVLVIRLGAIGDVTNALVFATALKDAAPRTHVAWVVHPLARPLVEGHPCVDRVHVWERGGGWRALRRLLGELRRARYDLAVDLQRLQKSALLARLSGAPRVLGYDRARAKELSWLWTRERIPAGPPRAHMVEQYLEFARHLGVAPEAPRFELPRDEAAEAWAQGRLAELGGAPVLLNLGATKPANRWAPERFGELARRLAQESDVPLAFTGGLQDREAQAIAARVAGGGPLGLAGESSLPQLVALCRRARLFVGCDTGPMHLAAACGTPLLALFGPADEQRTGPYDRPEAVLRTRPPCAPCGARTCREPRHACMEDLDVERVLARVRQELASATPRARR